MEASTLLPLAAFLVAFFGSLSSFSISLRLCTLSRLVGDKSFCLLGYSFITYGVGLIIEAVNIVGVGFWLTSGPHGGFGRPELVERLLSGRGILLATPMYAVAYSLAAAGIYVGHVELRNSDERTVARSERFAAAALPFLAQLYIDYNIVLLVLLAILATMVYHYYRPPVSRSIVFYGIAASSHAVTLLVIVLGAHAVYLSTLLRSAAPLAFYIVALRGR